MQKKGVQNKPNYVTLPVFEKGTDFMAKSFAKVFERFEQIDKRFERTDKVLESMLKEMQTNSQDAKDHRMMMGSLNHSDINQERKINGLEMRIEKLEQKIK